MKNAVAIYFLPVLIFLLALPRGAAAQTDTAFWFAAPEVSVSSNNFDIPIVLRLSTSNLASTVTVSQPANPGFTPITVNIPANSTSSIDLSTYLNIIENKPPNTVLNYGLHISASQPVTAYWDVVSSYCGCNPELYSFKGRNALGTYFLIPAQTYYNNSSSYNPVPYASFIVVATEDNTTVNITPSHNIVGHTAGTPFAVTLNCGQTWCATSTVQTAGQHLQGSVVTSNKPVAVTVSDDLLAGPGGCADLAGDQIVPVNIVGSEYIVARGGLNVERVAILGTQNNTDIFLDGNPTPVANIGLGQTYEFTLSNPSVYITSSQPVYVLHVSGNGCEIGSALLPHIVCTGSQQIGFTRASTMPIYLNLVVRTPSTGFFELNGSTAYITSAMFSAVPGTGGQWSFARISFNTTQIPVGVASLIRLTNGDVFQMGILNGDVGGGCSYGYYSDFNSLHPNVSASAHDICLGQSSSLNAINGMNYQWSPATGLSYPNIANPVATPQVTTTYTVSVSNSYGCSATDTITIKVHPVPSLSFVKTDVLCNGWLTGAVDLSVTGGTPGFTYNWSNGANSQDLTGISAGTYTVTVTDNEGCSDTESATISQPPPLLLSLTPINVSCANNCDGQVISLAAGGAGNLSYLWSNGQTAPDATMLCDGNYSLTVTDTNGCTITDSVTVALNPQPFVDAGNDTSICFGGSVQLAGSPGLYYHWTPATGLSDTSISNPIASPVSTTTYYYTIFDASNSVLFNGDFEQGNTGFSSSYTYSPTINNEGYYYIVNNPYTWHGGLSPCADHTTGTGLMMVVNGSSVPNVNVWCQTVNVTPNTNYAFSCWLQSVHPTSPAVLQFSINGSLIGPPFNAVSTVCQWNQFYALWNSGSNTSAQICIVNQNTAFTGNDFALDDISFSPICPVTDTITITVSNLLLNDSVSDVSCNGGSDGTASVIPTSGIQPISYTWSTVPVQNTQTATGLAAGTYYVTVTDAIGCLAWDTLTVNEPDSLYAALSNLVNVNCYGANTGAASASASGGTPPYGFSWSNGATGSNAVNLAAGNYNLTVTDNNGCSVILPFTITQEDQIQIALNAQDESCENTCNGSITSQVSGGVPPYLWQWNTGGAANSITGLCAGNYSLTITDSHNCQMTATASISISTYIEALAYADPQTGFAPAAISFYYTGSGASLYYWDFGDGNTSILQNPVHIYETAGEYTVTLIVNSGAPDFCTDTITLDILILEPSSVELSNVFTPNGDGANDVFIVKSTGLSTESMVIYNRWGRKVFEWNEVNGSWDGDNYADGVYYYIFSAFGFDGKQYNLTGMVTLLR